MISRAFVLIHPVEIVRAAVAVSTRTATKACLGWTVLHDHKPVERVTIGLASFVALRLVETSRRLAAAESMLTIAAAVQVVAPCARASLVEDVREVKV